MSKIRELSEELRGMDGILPKMFVDMEKHRGNPRILLILSCSFVELLCGVLINAYCVKTSRRVKENKKGVPLADKLDFLRRERLLDKNFFPALNWLRDCRNKAAHEADFVFEDNDMPTWGGHDHQKVADLFSLCATILANLWNYHVELFREQLPPGKY